MVSTDSSAVTSARSSFTLHRPFSETGAMTAEGPSSSVKVVDQAQLPYESSLHTTSSGVQKEKEEIATTIEDESGLKRYSFTFFAPELSELRRSVYKVLIVAMIITIIVMWSCLPLYWGSLWKSNKYTRNLTVRVLDYDNDFIGNTISNSLMSETSLDFFSGDITQFPNSGTIERDVVQEGVWATISIHNITSILDNSRLTGDSTYDPSKAISVYYVQARSETAVNTYLVPLIQSSLSRALGKINAQSTAEFFSRYGGNSRVMANISKAPLTINPGMTYSMVNLRPYNQPVATAITLVGLLYMLIFAVLITMVNNASREIIGQYLTTRSYILYRLIAPLILFLVLSFFFAMVTLPFNVHFDAHYTYAGGFFLWAFTCFLGMASTGLAAEFAITLIGDKLLAYFMIPLIISNVSVASLPHELQPGIFRYGAAMPFYNISRVVRTVIFDTKNEVAKNLGILLAWTVVSLITISLSSYVVRKREIRRVSSGDNDIETSSV